MTIRRGTPAIVVTVSTMISNPVSIWRRAHGSAKVWLHWVDRIVRPSTFDLRVQTMISMARRASVVALLALGASVAVAQGYPAKPIRLVVPFPPGGPADSMSRIVASKLGEVLGQGLVLENRGGGGGTIAMEQLAKAAPDGYTLGIGSNSTLAIAPSLYRKLPYDPLASFTHLGLIATVPTVLIAHASLPVATLRELIEYTRARPDTLNFGSNGNGTIPHLAGVLFQSLADVKLVHVPYKGMGPALNDLLAGQIQLGFFAASGREAQLRDGKVRALAVASPARVVNMPDVPTASEAGLPGFEIYTWFGLAGPQGLPSEITQRLNIALRTSLEAEDVAKRLIAQGLITAAGTPEQFRAFVASELAKWTPVVKALDLTLD